MAMRIMIEKQSTKIIKPFVQTPPTLSHYKLGFIDEFAPAVNVGVVFFFSAINNNNHHPNFFAPLEKSLAETLTRFYPLAGRYDDQHDNIIDCNDQGAEFTHAKVINNIKIEEFLVSQVDDHKFIDEFIPFKIGVSLQQSDPLLAAQVTTFACGGVAIGVTATHKIVDASTLCMLVNEWGVRNREMELTAAGVGAGAGFNSCSCSVFPGRGLSSIPMPPMNDDMLNKHMRKKLSFSESLILNIKAKGKKRWSKVQIASAIIWKTLMCVDAAIRENHPTHYKLLQLVNLREKMASSLITKNSCGNFWGFCLTVCKQSLIMTTEELTDLCSDSVKKFVTSISNNKEESGQEEMVLNSLVGGSNNIHVDANHHVVGVTSWCKFPFYAVDFGYGKPIWVAPGTIPIKNTAYLMDDAQGNGVEAYVFLQLEDVPYFEEALANVLKPFAA
ncbi:hypothetical protein R6Q57_022302 [Mikania cordata]